MVDVEPLSGKAPPNGLAGQSMRAYNSYVNIASRAVLLLFLLVRVPGDTGLHRVTPAGVRMPVTPETAEYRLVDALPGLRFENPVLIVSVPGQTNSLFVVERAGRIVVVADLQAPSRQVFLDIKNRVNSDYMNLQTGAEGLTGAAFHPRFSENGFVYVTYTHRTGDVNYNRLSRFQAASITQASASSEFVLIDQPDTGYGHNFNDIRFGPDGYLYLASGDEGDGGGAGDEFENSQRIDKDFFSAVMRIDVDLKRSNLTPNPHPAFKGGYRIPSDNPFVGASEFNGSPVDPSKVRTEFYAVGFRNPWRIAFDSTTGALYAADVGRKAAEEVNLVRKGRNYGWGYREGASFAGPRGNPPASLSLTDPLLDYPHGFSEYNGLCVIGGEVYRGTRMPELHGAYIFADYHSGSIWSLRHDGVRATKWQKIAGLYFVAGFGTDPRNGDILVCYDKIEENSEVIYRLDHQPGSTGSVVPPTLAETGLFEDLTRLTPVQGFVPYEVNVPFWSDGARKTRWFGLLDAQARIGFQAEAPWSFPAGTVWIKHFELELEKGNPASRKRLETRVLVKNASTDGLYGVTYRWGDSTSNAMLVPAEGATEPFEVRDGATTTTVNWRYPSRSECLACHKPSAGYALGFQTAQLNREFQYPLSRTNQIIALHNAGYLDGPQSNSRVHTLRRLAGLHEGDWSREYRARSYLAANCANCHHPGGVERSRWDGRIATPLSEAKIVQGELVDLFGHPDNRVVAPGNPQRSVLLQRMSNLGPGHMPPLGTSVIDTEAVQLLTGWIRDDLAGYETFEQWAAAIPPAEAAKDADPDNDGAPNWIEYLLATDPTLPDAGSRPALSLFEDEAVLTFTQAPNRGFELLTTSDLFSEDSWKPLEIVENAPFFSSENISRAIAFPLSRNQNRYYRVRIYEP